MTFRHDVPDGDDSLPGTSPVTGALLLAAGFSRRFGGIKLNARLPNGLSVLQQSFNNISQAFDEIIVVGRQDLGDLGTYDALALHPNSHKLVFCDDAESGMGHTLACGARAIPAHWQACFVCLGDMPFIQPDTLRTLQQHIQQHVAEDRLAEDRLVVPVWRQQQGHPIGFGRRYFPALQQCHGDKGARHLLRDPATVTQVTIDDPGVIQDIDTPEDLPN